MSLRKEEKVITRTVEVRYCDICGKEIDEHDFISRPVEPAPECKDYHKECVWKIIDKSVED